MDCDEFGDQEAHVGIALAVAMGAHVHWHAVDSDGEVGAVVEVEAAQVVLVGFALAGMLGDDQARRRFQVLAGARIGLLDDALGGAVLLAGGIFRLGLAGGCGDVDDLGQLDGLLRGCR